MRNYMETAVTVFSAVAVFIWYIKLLYRYDRVENEFLQSPL